jgi:hypothetical protein
MRPAAGADGNTIAHRSVSMKFEIRTAAAAAGTVFAALCCMPVHADCTYPPLPGSPPDGNTVSKPDLVAALHDMKRFNADIDTYTACIDKEADDKVAAGGPDMKPEQVKRIRDEATAKHNSAVDDVQRRANDLNMQVLVFKARHAQGS